MNVTILGSSSGTPTKSRNVSAVAVSLPGVKTWYLVDCGEGTQQQILRTSFSLNRLQAIFISHVHGDHCYGLPGLLASASMAGRSEALSVIAPAGVAKFMAVIIEETQMKLSYHLEFIDIASLQVPLNIDRIGVDIIALSHRTPSYGFRFTNRSQPQKKLNIEKLIANKVPQGEIWGRLHKGETVILDGGRTLVATDYQIDVGEAKKLIVCGDNDTPQLLEPYLENVALVVHEATYTEDVAIKVGSGPQHSYAKLVAEFAQFAGLENLVLTHFSPRYSEKPGRSPSMTDIENEAKAVYRGNIFFAKDFDCYQVDAKGKVALLRRPSH